MNTYAVTYGQIAGRGGWMLNGQDLIEASSYESALNQANYRARKWRDRVLEVRLIYEDKDLLDYDNEEVI